jgi:hypothetical protein
MRKLSVLTVMAVAGVISAATLLHAQPYGPGMMGGGYGPGYGMMQGYGPGYGMMGQGYGPGWMRGPGYGPGMMGG